MPLMRICWETVQKILFRERQETEARLGLTERFRKESERGIMYVYLTLKLTRIISEDLSVEKIRKSKIIH